MGRKNVILGNSHDLTGNNGVQVLKAKTRTEISQIRLDCRSEVDKPLNYRFDGAPSFGTFRPTDVSFAPIGPAL